MLCNLRRFDHIVKCYCRANRLALVRCYASNRQIGTRTIKPTCDALRMRMTRMASVAVDAPSEDFGKKLTLSNEVKDDFVTKHLYYNDTELCECKGKIIGARLIDFQGGSRCAIILDQTVMHPQGGGQPTDTGFIKRVEGDETIEFQVVHVQKPSRDSNYIEHIGSYQAGTKQFAVGDQVEVFVNAVKRRLHARKLLRRLASYKGLNLHGFRYTFLIREDLYPWCLRIHSAGHLLDSAFINLGWTVKELEPLKGYHFPDGPYVEYIGNIPAEKREEVIKQLNEESARLIQKQIPVTVSRNDQGERIVNVGGTECPCGGTHIKNTSWIGAMVVTKMKKSKKNIRVSYEVMDA